MAVVRSLRWHRAQQHRAPAADRRLATWAARRCRPSRRPLRAARRRVPCGGHCLCGQQRAVRHSADERWRRRRRTARTAALQPRQPTQRAYEATGWLCAATLDLRPGSTFRGRTPVVSQAVALPVRSLLRATARRRSALPRAAQWTERAQPWAAAAAAAVTHRQEPMPTSAPAAQGRELAATVRA